jgi:hypothetical protein
MTNGQCHKTAWNIDTRSQSHKYSYDLTYLFYFVSYTLLDEWKEFVRKQLKGLAYKNRAPKKLYEIDSRLENVSGVQIKIIRIFNIKKSDIWSLLYFIPSFQKTSKFCVAFFPIFSLIISPFYNYITTE